MAKRRSILAEHYELPLEDWRHLQLRDDGWIGGPEIEAAYYLSWLKGYNAFDQSYEQQSEALRDLLRQELPQSIWLAKTRYLPQFFLIWVKAKYRLSTDGQRFPIRKPSRPKEDKAIILLMENPSLTDEDIRQELNTTEKAMQRWSDYKTARVERTRYQK